MMQCLIGTLYKSR